MELAEEYIANRNLQHRDTTELINEYSFEISQMGRKCLDIGCGPGQVTKEILLDLLPKNAEIIGADISQKMIDYAREKYADKRLSYIVLDIESLDLPNEQYDNVISCYCLHWCKDIRRAFANIYKLLRPGGKTLVMFLAKHDGFNAYVRLKQNPRFQPYLQDAHRYVPYFQKIQCKNMKASLDKMLQKIGFKVLRLDLREKSFRCSKESLTNHAYAVNPFIKRFPEKIKQEYLEALIDEIISHDSCQVIEENIIMKYYLLIAYMQKPSSV